jgi:hypothetical protein
LPWKKKREEYFRQTGKWRSISSLRSKLEQLDQGIRRRRPLYEEVVQPGYAQNLRLQRSLLEELPLSPPPLILKTPDPVARRILEQWRQAEVYQDSISARRTLPGEVFTPPSTPLSRNPSIQSEDWHDSPLTKALHADICLDSIEVGLFYQRADGTTCGLQHPFPHNGHTKESHGSLGLGTKDSKYVWCN